MELPPEPFKDRDSVGWNPVVVAEQDSRLIGERPNYRDFDAGGLQRQGAVVLEQDHGLIGEPERECAMLGAVE